MKKKKSSRPNEREGKGRERQRWRRNTTLVVRTGDYCTHGGQPAAVTEVSPIPLSTLFNHMAAGGHCLQLSTEHLTHKA